MVGNVLLNSGYTAAGGVVSSNTFNILVYVLTAVSFIAGFSLIGWFFHWLSLRQVGKTREHPNGQMLVEIRSKDARWESTLCKIKPSGLEVEPPPGLQTSVKLLFNPTAVGTVRYPDWMPFDFLRVDCRKATWWINHSVAIDPLLDECPHCHQEIVVAKDAIPADLQYQLQDRDTLAMGDELLMDAEAEKKELGSAIRNTPNKWWVYILTGMGTLLGLLATIFAYMAWKAVKDIR